MRERPEKSPEKGSVIYRFFTGITEYAFHVRLGVVDPPLVDYVAQMMTRFCRHDQVFSIRSTTGQRLDQLVDMVREARARKGESQREIQRHIGDFTLFWTGVYPEAVEKKRQTGSPDGLLDYQAQGKQAYRIASTIPSGAVAVEGDLLARLSHQFELCAYGLGEVRREWERRDGPEDLVPIWGQ